MWGDEPSNAREKRTPKQVSVITLDSLLVDWATVDFLKIDIQGYEPAAIRGLRETLARGSVRVMLLEFWPYGLRRAGFEPEQLLSDLWAQGLRTWSVLPGCLKAVDSPEFVGSIQGSAYANLLVVHSEAAKDVTQRVQDAVADVAP